MKAVWFSVFQSNDRFQGGQPDDVAHDSHSRINPGDFFMQLDLLHAAQRAERV